MQKKLIALAVAGLASGAAFAQSNVTIYGVADASWESVKAESATAGSKADVASRSRLSSNSSLLGFKGTEDLGNGLKAVFQFEGGVSLDTGLSTFSARDTFVGLAGGFGTVVAGNLTHPIRAFGAKVDQNPGATGIAFAGSIFGEVNGVKTGTDDRASNTLAYVSPSFNGFSATAAYVNGENKKNAEQNGNASITSNQWQLAGQYDNGPLFVGIGYHEAKDPQVASALGAAPATGVGYGDKLKATRIAATYKLPSNTTLAALWDQQKYTTSPALGNGVDTKRTAWFVGATQEFGNIAAYLQYARANNLTGTNDTGARLWTIGADYKLSKRTMVKAYYADLRNEANAKYDFYVNGVGSVAAGADPKGFGVGLRHTF